VGGVELDVGGEEEEVNLYISIQPKRVLASYLNIEIIEENGVERKRN
jgi:hypothetical protein